MNCLPGSREGTYCVFIQPLAPLQEAEIVNTAKSLKDIKTFAVVKKAGIYVVMNFTTRKEISNLRRDLPKHFEDIGVFTLKAAKAEDTVEVNGIFHWVRNFHELLRDRLQDAEPVYPHPPLFPADVHATELQQVSSEEKLEIMNNPDEWPDNLEAETAEQKCIEDFIPFSKAFEKLFPYYKEDKTLQQECAKMFGDWAPEVRTKARGPHDEYVDKPVTHMVQVPPWIREKLSSRMQCKDSPHLCWECGKPRTEANPYCSEKHAQLNSALVCPCGSTNVQTKRQTITLEEEESSPPKGPGIYTCRSTERSEASSSSAPDSAYTWDDKFWWGPTGRDEQAAQKREQRPENPKKRKVEHTRSETVCLDCNKVLFFERVSLHRTNNEGNPYKRRALDDHQAAWTLRKRS